MTEKAPPTRSSTQRRAAQANVPELPILAKIMNNIIELDPDYYFKQRYDDIIKAASELPVVIEYINESLQRASISAMQAKTDIESLAGETYMRLRQDWTTLYTDKMTEDSLSHAVAMDKDLKEARNNYAVLKSYVGRLANMQENLRAKLDVLRSAEATRRKLISDDPEDKT